MLKRSLVLLSLLVTLLAVTLIVPMQSHAQTKSVQQATQVTIPNATRCRNYDVSGMASPLYFARVTGQICYDGSNVWVTRNDCSYVTWGVSINQTWCGPDQTGSVAEVGSNYQVTILYKGFPVSYPSYFRARFDKNGNYTGWSGAY